MSTTGIPQPSSDTAAAFAPMFDPDGNVRMIPQERLQDALGAGGKYAVRMIDPSGTKRYIPHDRVTDALRAGGQMAPDEPVVMAHPAAATEGFWHSLASATGVPTTGRELLEHVVGAVFDPAHLMRTTLALPSMIKTAGSSFKQAGQEAMAAGRDTNPLTSTLHTAAATAHVLAGVTSPVGGGAMEKAGTQLGTGDVAGGLGTTAGLVGSVLAGGKLAKVMAPKAPVAAATTLPESTEALTSMIDTRGGNVDPHEVASSALPDMRNAAAKLKVTPEQFYGRNGGQLALKVADTAKRSIQAEVAEITKPYETLMTDQSSIAAAYRSQITPELQANAPDVAARLEKEAAKFDRPAPLSQVNQTRIRLNNETSALQGKAQGAFQKSDLEAKADVLAVQAARDLQYDTLTRVSGLEPEYIRSLKQREGNIIEARNSIEKEYNQVSGQQAEAVAGSLKANPPGSGRFISTMQEKASHLYPSRRGMERSLIRETIAPKPIDTFNNRMKLMFDQLGEHQPRPTYQQVQQPAAPNVQAKHPAPAATATATPTKSPYAVIPEADAMPLNFKRNGEPPGVNDVTLQLNGEKVGTAHVGPNPYVKEGALEVKHIKINEDLRGKPEHHGTQFYKELANYGRERGATELMSDVKREPGAEGAWRGLAKEYPGKVKYNAEDGRWHWDITQNKAPATAAVKPTLTQKVQAQPLPRLQRVEQPAPPPVTKNYGQTSTTMSAATSAAQRAAIISATMSALKSGEITQQEADRRIQRVNGGGGRKLVRMPAPP